MTVPRVSVIIATYNWSAALACALRSVRLQNFTDYEVLVVGDACTDDSEQVVASMNDPRFRWFNRATNAGSQWGPNNDGISRSEAEYIAYLGHDDLWYPTHLESLVRVADAQRADVACAIAVMYGPADTGVRAVSGVYIDGTADERQFMVPSALLHRRSLVERIGPWRDAAEAGIPTDCDLILRAMRAGAVFAASNELTVFKFNAAWRRNAYGARPTHEQRALLARIEQGGDFRQAELVEIIRAILSNRYVELRMPLPGEATSRAMRGTRQYKGVSAGTTPVAPLDRPVCLRLDEQPASLEWYPPENSPAFGSFRWSGPATVCALQFPFAAPRGTRLDLSILASASPDQLAGCTLEVGGRATPHEVHPAPEGRHWIRCVLNDESPPGQPISIRLRLPPNTPRASDPDRRPRGLALSTVLLTPPGQSPLLDLPRGRGWKDRLQWPWLGSGRAAAPASIPR